MKKLLLLLFIPTFLNAQEAAKKPVLIKFAPLSHIDFDNTIQLGSEQMLNKSWSIQEELGYGNIKMNVWGQDYYFENKDKETYRAKLEVRKYKNYGYGMPIGNYWAIETFFKQVNKIDDVTIGRECSQTWNCAYQERIEGIRQKLVFGGHIKLGRQFYIKDSGQKTRFVLDFYMGVGLRYINIGNSNYDKRENDTIISNNGFTGFQRNVGSFGAISGAMGLKLGYLVRGN
jgi:hypothetical protein